MSGEGLLEQEDGLTLIELLVVIVLLGVVGAITISGIVTSQRAARWQVEYTHTLNESKKALERITGDIRGANPLLVAEADRLEFEMVRSAGRHTVTVETSENPERPSTYVLQVTDCPPASPCSARTELVGLREPEIFSFPDAGDPGGGVSPTSVSSVTIDVEVDVAHLDTTVDLTTRVALRNR